MASEFTYKIDGKSGSVEITKYVGTQNKVCIPKEIDGLPVTSIGNEAFTRRSDLTEIVMPDSVANIGEYAFSYGESLKEIILPEGLRTIRTGAFFRCHLLRTVVMSDNVSHIGEGAFCGCSRLKDINLSNCLTRIERRLFMGCLNLANITLPETVTHIGAEAFRSCTSLSSILLPESLAEIGNEAFLGCSALPGNILDRISNIEQAAMLERERMNKLKSAQPEIGDVISFGKHEWLVLAMQADKILLLSKYILQTRVYHSDCDEEMKPVDTTWEDCSLREYLNVDFFNDFSAEEQGRIVETWMENHDNLWYGTSGGGKTCDKVFLLSIEDVDQYFGNSGDYLSQKRSQWENNTAVESSLGKHLSNEHDSARAAQIEGGGRVWWWASLVRLGQQKCCRR